MGGRTAARVRDPRGAPLWPRGRAIPVARGPGGGAGRTRSGRQSGCAPSDGGSPGGRDATLAAQKATLFQGETLRGILLNAYGWAQLGQYMLFAGIGAAAAALIVLGTFVFELVADRRRAPVADGRDVPGKAASASI